MPTTWRNVRGGQSGIGPIESFDTNQYAVKIAGEVRGFDAASHIGRKHARRCDRNAQFALVAAGEALANAQLELRGRDALETGVFIASGAGGIATYIGQQRELDRRGPQALSPLLIPMIVVDSASVQVGLRYGAQGPNLGIASACSSSLDSIGLAAETIRRGDAEVMLAGGSEAAVNELGIGAFDRMRALSRRNHDPQGACRPFDVERDGFVLSEGAVVLVLESLAHARARGASPLAEIRSYASCSDARHLTAPDETGAGAIRCMARALDKAGLQPEGIDYLSAHGTGTPMGDPIEAAAIRKTFGSWANELHVSAIKSSTGHLLGGAGALAVAVTCCALQEGCLPPTINLREVDPRSQLRHVSNHAIRFRATTALVPSFGFGGHNSALVLSHPGS